MERRFVTIRQAAKMPEIGLPECNLRRMIKTGEVPGFYTGKRYYINTQLFVESMDKKSVAAADA